MTDDVRLEGGSMTHVVRVGDTVRRSPGRQSAAVQALLRHLHSEGVDGAPRALGFDDQGRETLTFIDGELGFDVERRRFAGARFAAPSTP